MTTTQITSRDDQAFILLGRYDVPVPGPLADAIRQLASGGRSHRGVGSPAAGPWLIPGHMPGRPITSSRLGERLRSIGIYAQTGRRAALLDLAAQLPAVVLADLLGLHETTAANGYTKPEETGPATPPSYPAVILTSTDEYLPSAVQHRDLFGTAGKPRCAMRRTAISPAQRAEMRGDISGSDA